MRFLSPHYGKNATRQDCITRRNEETSYEVTTAHNDETTPRNDE